MQKPNNYDNVSAPGEFTPIELGGHKLKIMQVEELINRAGKPMIKISFDTAPDDKQPNYYSDQYKSDTREQKKWSGVSWLNVLDQDGNTAKSFKGFCTSIEESNPGFTMVWGDGFANALKNKLIGGVFGEEEYQNDNGDIKTARKLRFWRSVDGALKADVPEKKCLQGAQGRPSPVDANGFVNIPDELDELPFN